jgi:transcriptional regulator
MIDQSHLRPMERRVLALRDEGIPIGEIARRFDRSPEHITRVIQWTELPRSRPPRTTFATAMASRVLTLRSEGATYEEIVERFRRGAGSIRQIEGLAHYRRGLSLLETGRA